MIEQENINFAKYKLAEKMLNDLYQRNILDPLGYEILIRKYRKKYIPCFAYI